MNATLQSWARALGGEVCGEQVLCPGPGHSADDRSLSVKIGADGEPIVHSFAGNDWRKCLDHVRQRLGMAPFKPDAGRKGVATYDFCDPSTGAVRYRKERIESADGTKSFFKPAGRNGCEPLLYGGERLADLAEGQHVFVVEGEKKVDRLRELGAVAVSGDSGASSKWLPAHADLLRGLPIILWPDSDEPGEKYAARAADCLRNSAASLRVVRPFGPPNGAKGRDVCDWAGSADDLAALAALAAGAEVYEAREQKQKEPFIDGQANGEPWHNGPDARGPKFRRIINPADWEGLPIPERETIVPDYIPHKTITLFSGDGGTGKSILSLQLGVARAIAREWIGLMPEPGRTLILSAEDDADEMHRRLEDIRKFYNASFREIGEGLRLIDNVGEDSILGMLMKGQIMPTHMYHALDEYMAEWQPSLTVIDVLADVFGGNENDRPQARQFIGLLKKLARKYASGFLLLSHPSLTGMNTGTGTSGTTGWNNSVRSRLYFQTMKDRDGNEPNKNLRTIEGMKHNYGERGGKIDLEWKNGLFVPAKGLAGFDKMAAEAKAIDVFLAILKRFNAHGRNATDKKGTSYAPALFEKEPDSGGIRSAQFETAMRQLFKDNKIKIVDHGRPSKPAKTLEPSEGIDNV